ncbi:37954_t:CDS:2, partial [Gigaspora margarita]
REDQEELLEDLKEAEQVPEDNDSNNVEKHISKIVKCEQDLPTEINNTESHNAKREAKSKYNPCKY